MARGKAQDRPRAGSRALSIFTYALNARTIRSHAEGPLRSSELEGRIGWAPQSSLRAAVANLCELGVLSRSESTRSSKGTVTELTDAGRDLLTVADRLERWLQRAPAGPIGLDAAAAPGAVRALIAGWDSLIVRVLAERSLTLTELAAEIADVSYSALERSLARLRSTHLVTPIEGSGKGKPYEASEWLRHAIAPLSIAGRWELGHLGEDVAPISPIEVESTFLLGLPLIELSPSSSGACVLAVLTSAKAEHDREVAGVSLGIRRGQIVSCASTTVSNPRTWALGTPDAWLDAVVEGRLEALRVQGTDPDLPLDVVRDFHEVLFPPLDSANLRALRPGF